MFERTSVATRSNSCANPRRTVAALSAAIALAAGTSFAHAQSQIPASAEPAPVAVTYTRSLGTSYLTFMNFGPEKTNTHHVELHVEYRPTPRDTFGIKVASWELFAPMGIPMWNESFLDEREFFPGRIKERGLGLTYRRTLWKGSFAAVEILPLVTTYLEAENRKVGRGFKLYTSYHLGYRLAIIRKRMFLEPQVHCNYWPVDTGMPPSFAERSRRWHNYFLFEPNVYIGVNF